MGLLLKEDDLKIVQEHTAGTISAALSINSLFFFFSLYYQFLQFLVIHNIQALRNTHKRSVYNIMFNEASHGSLLKAHVVQKKMFSLSVLATHHFKVEGFS